MNIISNFKDYYDYLSDYTDKEHSWVRNRPIDGSDRIVWINPSNDKYLKNTEIPAFLDNKIYFDLITKSISIDLGILLFCGDLYPLWTIDSKKNYYLRELYGWDNCPQRITGYDKQSLSNFIEYAKIILKDKRIGDGLFNRRWGSGEYIDKIFDHQYINQFKDQLKQLHFEYNCPVILLSFGQNEKDNNHYNHRFYRNSRGRLILNPILEQYDFQSVVYSFNCYQKLDTFLFNELLTKENNIPEPSDKLKAESKGFDKWSFRKEPNNKRIKK